MKKYFKVGEVAKLLGVSTDALRLYDKKGILSPIKNENNNYRSYTVSDFICLDYIVSLRKLHMPLIALNKLINHSSIESERKAVINQEEAIRKKITELNKLLLAVKDFREDLDQVIDELNTFKVVTSPKMITLDLDNVNDKAIEKFSKLDVEQIPFFTFFYDKDNHVIENLGNALLDEEFKLGIYRHGRTILDCDNKFEDKELENSGLIVSNPSKCLNVIMNTYPNKDYSCVDEIMKYCEDNNYEVIGDIIIKVISVRRVETSSCDYYEAWIPIK
ncbi:MAG: MerR family transcriptional regulator [Peptostreptococcaceae bacterium]|nr:MerR family transcriptional regulator [Peptostreptococcaceae bacterium]